MLRSLLAAALLTPGLLSGQTTTLSWTEPLPCGVQAQGNLRPRIALNGDGDAVVVWGRSGMAANFASVGSAAGFSTPQQLTYMSSPPAVADWMGADVAALGNEVWMCFKATPEDARPMYARRSTDGGYTWGDTIRIAADPWARFPSITIGTAGAPVVQYMQFDEGFVGARYATVRMNAGAFQTPVQVSTPFAPGEVCDCCPGQVMASGDVVVPLYRNAGSNIRVIYGALSTDGGASYVTGGQLDGTNWNVSMCPASGPDGYFANDSIRYVWMSGAVSGSKVNLGSAALDDLATGGRVMVHPGQTSANSQNFPRIAGSGDTLGVVWEQTVMSNRNILFSWSTTGTYGLSIPDTVNIGADGEQSTPDIAYADGAFHIVWSNDATGEVNYRTATLTNTTGVDEATDAPAFIVWPMPANNTLHVTLSGGQQGTMRLVDAAGHCVLTAPSSSRELAVGHLAAGRYVLEVIDVQGRSLGRSPVQIAR